MYFGHHRLEDLPVKQGDTVIIPKGTRIKSMHPRDRGNERIAGKTFKVKVHHLCTGSSCSMDGLSVNKDWLHGMGKWPMALAMEEEAREKMTGAERWETRVALTNPQVTWAGEGGYWMDADINDVLLLVDGKHQVKIGQF